MLSRLSFPQRLFAFVLAGALAIPAGAAWAEARADENLLRGPHPFLKDNEVAVHLLFANGVGDAPGGTKLGLNYGYHLSGPSWLNLQLNMQLGSCRQPCNTTKAFETLAGAKFKFPTAIPLVPYVKAAGGLVFVFPGEGESASGLGARVGGGASYFLFDWLGLGVEANLSVASVDYGGGAAGGVGASTNSGYTVFDVGGGVELQF